MDNGFVFRAPKCINPENFIKIRALLESLVYQYPRFLHLRGQKSIRNNILLSPPINIARNRFFLQSSYTNYKLVYLAIFRSGWDYFCISMFNLKDKNGMKIVPPRPKFRQNKKVFKRRRKLILDNQGALNK
jgi:hypothetical protein